MQKRFCLLFAPLALLLTAFAAHAQLGSDGAILGVVTDPSGAVVAGATVTATNAGTGLRRSATSNDAGIFEVLALPNGTYSVSVTMNGFKTWSTTGAELRIGERKRLAPVLEVGQVSEQVAVEAQVELIQTDKASVGGTVEQRQMVGLPLNGRNPIGLVRLVPGMRFVSDRSGRARHYGAGHGQPRRRHRVPGGRSQRQCRHGRAGHHHPQRRHDFRIQCRDGEFFG